MAFVKIFKAGSYVKDEQAFTVTPAMLAKLVANFQDKKISTTKLPVFLGHSPMGVEAPAVAWIKSLRCNGEWLEADIEWTNSELASDIRQNESFKYFSIEACLNDFHPNTGDPIGPVLEGLAVTNKPFIREIPELRLSKPRKQIVTLSAINLATPPGMEALVRKLKEQYPDEPEKAYATAWAIYNGTVNRRRRLTKETIMTDTNTNTNIALAEDAMAPEGEMPAMPKEEAPKMSLLDLMREHMGNPELSEEDAAKALLAILSGGMERAEGERASEPMPEEAQAEMARLAASKSTLESLTLGLKDEVAQLKTRLAKYEEKELEALVNNHIALGAIPAGKRADYIALAKSDRALFDRFVSNTGSPTKPANGKVALGKGIVSKAAPEPMNAADLGVTREMQTEYGKNLIAQMRKTLKLA